MFVLLCCLYSLNPPPSSTRFNNKVYKVQIDLQVKQELLKMNYTERNHAKAEVIYKPYTVGGLFSLYVLNMIATV